MVYRVKCSLIVGGYASFSGGNARGILSSGEKRGGYSVYKGRHAHASLILSHHYSFPSNILAAGSCCLKRLVQPCSAGSKPVCVLIGGLFPQPRAEASNAASFALQPAMLGSAFNEIAILRHATCQLMRPSFRCSGGASCMLDDAYLERCYHMLVLTEWLHLPSLKLERCTLVSTFTIARLKASSRTMVGGAD